MKNHYKWIVLNLRNEDFFNCFISYKMVRKISDGYMRSNGVSLYYVIY